MEERTISQIVFDLETIPGPDKPKPEDIKVPPNYKNPEAIEKYQNDPKRINEQYKKQALSYIEGRIHTIGFKIGTDPVGVVFHHDNEAMVLKGFEEAVVNAFKEHYGNDTAYGTTLVGHNIRLFDIPFLWLRAQKYGCHKLLRIIGATPDDIKFIDTMMVACVTDKYKGFVSLDNACKFFGLPGKGDVTGADVYDLWKAGKDQEIADYCADDVQKTHDLAAKLGVITL